MDPSVEVVAGVIREAEASVLSPAEVTKATGCPCRCGRRWLLK